MKILKALSLIGRYTVAEGFWRNISITLGLVGMAIFLLVAAITKNVPFNWFTLSLVLVLATMATLPLYLPNTPNKKK